MVADEFLLSLSDLATLFYPTAMAEGGIQVCDNVQNCVAVCPKSIPLTTSIAKAGRATTIHAIKKWFDR